MKLSAPYILCLVSILLLFIVEENSSGFLPIQTFLRCWTVFEWRACVPILSGFLDKFAEEQINEISTDTSSSSSSVCCETTTHNCMTATTDLQVFVLQQDEDNAAVSSAHVHYVDSEELRSTTTDTSGSVTLTVTGCRPSLTVHARGDKAIYKEIDLSHFDTKSSERIVVQMNRNCNFRVYFDNKKHADDADILGDNVDIYSERLTYMYQSGTATGHGEFTAKLGAALCIYIPTAATRLEMIVTGQTGNQINILDIAIPTTDAVNDYEAAAVMTVPRLVTDVTTDGMAFKEFDIIVNLNLWQFTEDLSTTAMLDTASVLDSTAAEVAELVTDLTDSTGFHVTNGVGGIGSTGVYLISATLTGSGEIKGNAFIMNYDTDHVSTEIDQNAQEYTTGHYWLIGCLCQGTNLDYYQEIDTFDDALPTDDTEFDAICTCTNTGKK